MNRTLKALKTNLLSGLDLILLRKCRLQDFHICADQAVLLLLLGLLLDILGDYIVNLPNPQFSRFGFSAYGFSLTCFLFSCYVIAKIIDRSKAALSLIVLIYSAMPLLYLTATILQLLSRQMATSFAVYGVTFLHFVLLAILLCRPLRMLTLPLKRFSLLGITVFSLLWLTPVHNFGNYDFWYREETNSEEDPYLEYRVLNVEQIMFDQARLLQDTFSSLQAGREGRLDIFSINFAGYAYQDVFMKEVAYTQDLLDRRFGTKNHSVRLVNHLHTYQEIPLASATNLLASLKHIGKLMNRGEDLVILYLTSHGSKDPELAIDFWPLQLNNITPTMLRTMLDEAGIQWRVIIISACYSGGFIDTLKTEYSLIATAAAPDRTSFGCSNENNFTYFGEALFKDQLSHEFSMIKAFQQAAASIAIRETAEQLTPSQPRLYVGKHMAAKLAALTTTMSERFCRAQPDSESC